MLDLGWSELLIIGVVALIVVGPKDLPKMLRTLGQYVGRAKGIAREFQRSMDDAARQADIEELREVEKGLDDMRDAQHKMQRDLGQSFLDSPEKSTTKKSIKSPATETPAGKSPAAKKSRNGPAPKTAHETVKAETPKPAKKTTKKRAKKPDEPRAEPGSVSGT
jgi:sec-independent protein translocase protein TatB